jgi:hypothetical protein
MAVSARLFHSAARFRQRRAISTRSNISLSAPRRGDSTHSRRGSPVAKIRCGKQTPPPPLLRGRSIVKAGRIWRPWNVLQYLPWHSFPTGPLAPSLPPPRPNACRRHDDRRAPAPRPRARRFPRLGLATISGPQIGQLVGGSPARLQMTVAAFGR